MGHLGGSACLRPARSRSTRPTEGFVMTAGGSSGPQPTSLRGDVGEAVRRARRRGPGRGSGGYLDLFEVELDTCSGLPLRLVEAISSSSFSLIESYMLLDAPLSALTFCLPRFAASAAPAAFC